MFIIPFSQSFKLSKFSISNISRRVLIAAMFAIFFAGCKKDAVPVIETEVKDDPAPLVLPDSIYFEVNGLPHTSKNISSVGMGNSGVRLKLLDSPAENMKDWGRIGGKFYCSPVDSIYFHYQKTFSASDSRATILFGKGMHTRDMVQAGLMWYTRDIRNILSKGKQNFAVDYQNTNAIDGVSFSFDRFGSTGMREFSFKNGADYPQDDSHFEIMKTEQVDQEKYRIEAGFALNLYDAEGKKTRVNKGFVRITVQKRWWGMVNIF